MDAIDRYRELDALLGEIEAPPEPVQAVERMRFKVGAIIQSKATQGIEIQVTEYLGFGCYKGLPFSEAAKRKYKQDYAMCWNNNWVEVTKEAR